MQPLTPHWNGHHLQTADGAPFFWMGDTAWELFHRLERNEIDSFLQTRASQGFNVIQAVALAEFDGLTEPNREGHLPLIDLDPTRPNDAYFSLVDWVFERAEALGLYIALLPTWGDKVTAVFGGGPVVLRPDNAGVYGGWLARRYGQRPNVVWVLGGDRPVIHNGQHDVRPTWRAMGEAIKAATGGRGLITYHSNPNGEAETLDWLHGEAWLDLLMLQSGHGGGHDVPVWDTITRQVQRRPPKPVLDGEPNYEDHPVNPWPTWDPANGYFRDHDVRKQMYRSVLAGGCGVTYGHHSAWQFASERLPYVNHADRDWRAALVRPGAEQIRYLRALMDRHPRWMPDQALLAEAPEGRNQHMRAARAGDTALVYTPVAQPVRLALAPRDAHWYDPRLGSVRPALTGDGMTFNPPADGPDWVLVGRLPG
jgi:hypothetical protein